jgi:hypothetical protein
LTPRSTWMTVAFAPLAIPTTAEQTCGQARIFMQRSAWRECPFLPPSERLPALVS